MAATKRALAIRAKKDGITQQINSISDQMRSIRIGRIPQSIVNGSFQRAVEFKALVELCSAPPFCPATASLERLERILGERQEVFQQLNIYTKDQL